jgi:L-ribulose-5-phosphate 3-epimerase
MKISGHTLGTPGMSLETSLHLFHQSGLDAAEIIWQNDYPAAIPEFVEPQVLQKIKHLAGELNLEIACLTPYMTAINSLDSDERQNDLRRFTRCIQDAQTLGCPNIRVYAGSYLEGEEELHDRKWQILVESLQTLASQAERASVRLCVENHFNTMTVSAAQTAELIQAVNSPAVRILYDQANLTFTHNEKHPQAIEIQKLWIEHVHVKDLVWVDENKPFIAGSVARVEKEARSIRSRVPGSGVLEWDKIISTLIQQSGYNAYLSLEYEYRWHPDDLPKPEEGFKLGAERIRNILIDLDDRSHRRVIE